ncbi:MAG TPA: CehA/McbA family metallohydrolase [Planctomycetota bacterium]|nr:CehA/McbA family metallohydrolase [Planctomycetota bacterium]
MVTALAWLWLLAQDPGRIHLTITEDEKPVPCRVHLKDASGKAVKPPGYPSWNDHFVCDGSAQIEASPGRYRLEVERGPEHSAYAEDLGVEAARVTTRDVRLKRLVDLAADGWWSGELHVHRPLADVELLMRAEDLAVAPVITWWNARSLWDGQEIPAERRKRFDARRFFDLMGGEDEREGGALMYFGLPRPLDIRQAGREYPSPVTYLREARKTPGVHVDVEKPFWWDVPVWLATGQVDTMGIAVNHFCRSLMHENEAWGKPRPVERLKPPLGVGYWVQEIYYHALNCGLRIAPSAGSASGVLPNPVGYNRAYVHLEGEPSYEKWMEGLRAGRSFVTNGPLLRVKANGQLPGHVFTGEKQVTVELAAQLDGREPVESFEIIRDGRLERSVAVKDPLGRLEFTTSGWFLVRSIAPHPKTFRFASTAPFYVEVGPAKHRISRASAKFFVDWIDERITRIPLKLKDPAQLEEVIAPQREARAYFTDLVNRADAD